MVNYNYPKIVSIAFDCPDCTTHISIKLEKIGISSKFLCPVCNSTFKEIMDGARQQALDFNEQISKLSDFQKRNDYLTFCVTEEA
jgi:predicted Zn finger-like uncharacterized protein